MQVEQPKIDEMDESVSTHNNKALVYPDIISHTRFWEQDA